MFYLVGGRRLDGQWVGCRWAGSESVGRLVIPGPLVVLIWLVGRWLVFGSWMVGLRPVGRLMVGGWLVGGLVEDLLMGQ